MKDKKESKVIYHYCTLSTFEKIIKNKTLRLSDITKSNDSEELMCLWESTQRYFKNVFEKEFNIFAGKKGHIVNQSWKSMLSKYKEWWLDTEFRDEMYYMMCFSEDGDLLSQWRGYADDAKGVSIGIDCIELKSLFENKKGIIDLYQVIYDEEEQNERIKPIVDDMVGDIKKRYDISEKVLLEQDLNPYFIKVFNRICSLAPMCKKSCFSEEKEFRICYKANRDSVMDYGRDNENAHFIRDDENDYVDWISEKAFFYPIQFTVIDNKIISYVDLCFQSYIFKTVAPIIKKIIIGPKCMATTDEIKVMMIQNGFDTRKIHVMNSSVTYR